MILIVQSYQKIPRLIILKLVTAYSEQKTLKDLLSNAPDKLLVWR